MVPTTDPIPHPDQQFIERLRRNDPAVWREIYKENNPKVTNYLRRRNAPADVAADLFHEALLVLDQRKATLVLTCKLSVFLLSVAIRQLKQYWRKKGKDPEQITDNFEELDRLALGDNEAEATQRELLQLAFADGTLLGLDTDLPNELLLRALALLSARCQDLFRLRYWEYLDDRQIADIIPMEYHLVRAQLYRCKEKLREVYEKLTNGR